MTMERQELIDLSHLIQANHPPAQNNVVKQVELPISPPQDPATTACEACKWQIKVADTRHKALVQQLKEVNAITATILRLKIIHPSSSIHNIEVQKAYEDKLTWLIKLNRAKMLATHAQTRVAKVYEVIREHICFTCTPHQFREMLKLPPDQRFKDTLPPNLQPATILGWDAETRLGNF